MQLEDQPQQAITPEPTWLERALGQLSNSRVTVAGDFCLDAYWLIDSDESELSLETRLPVRRIRQQRYSPGGAGNVVANLSALGVREVRTVGAVGGDLFGEELVRRLTQLGADTSGLLKIGAPWQTSVYAKPYLGNAELNRMDFGAYNEFPEAQLDTIFSLLDQAAAASDVVILNQQLRSSFFTRDSIHRINDLIKRHATVVFVVDSRDWAGNFENAILKVNAHEAAKLVGKERPLQESISREDTIGFARQLGGRISRPVFLTRGENGIVVVDGDQVIEIPGIQVLGKTDSVGAGDTVVAGIAAVLGGGGDVKTAAQLANLAASITVSKVMTTGTATPLELREAGAHPDYIYEPELATAPRNARYLPNTEIEIVREQPHPPSVRHAIFDHDGTISVLRHGWEKIMEPMMMKAILGDKMATAPEGLFNKVKDDARTFIDRTTGIQTLAQMKGLISLVREYNCVPEAEILDEHGYKAVYNEALLEMIKGRVQKIERGEFDPYDYEVKGARKFLQALYDAGVKLYLASGTDEDDVKAEATIMGYAHLFEGRIHGAVGDLKVEAKRVVLERIINSGHISGKDLLVAGDGPVEIREGRKRGAFCLGIASNEQVRHGLELTKRSRLIRAGADIIVPDFSQLDRILPLIGVKARA
jgi:rfaE bifunctional protein kinase chain/domain